MSAKHPIVAITGSSGAGTTTVMSSFKHIFRRDGINAQVLEGDSMHRYDRLSMRAEMKRQMESGNMHFSHFGPEANLLRELEEIFRTFSQSGTGKVRRYIHDAAEGAEHKQEPGTFTPWQEMVPNADLLFYEGLHGGYVGPYINVAQHVDLLVGVVPIINLSGFRNCIAIKICVATHKRPSSIPFFDVCLTTLTISALSSRAVMSIFNESPQLIPQILLSPAIFLAPMRVWW